MKHHLAIAFTTGTTDCCQGSPWRIYFQKMTEFQLFINKTRMNWKRTKLQIWQNAMMPQALFQLVWVNETLLWVRSNRRSLGPICRVGVCLENRRKGVQGVKQLLNLLCVAFGNPWKIKKLLETHDIDIQRYRKLMGNGSLPYGRMPKSLTSVHGHPRHEILCSIGTMRFHNSICTKLKCRCTSLWIRWKSKVVR